MSDKPIIIDIPNVGPVEFPSTMSQEEIDVAAKKLHDESNKEPVVEKESPELFGGAGATLGAIGAAGDVIYSKGRPIIRAGEKLLGMDSGMPPAPKPRTFADPSAVAERAIQARTPGGAAGAVENYGRSQFVSPEGKGLFYGAGETGEYSGARKAAEEAIAAEKRFPGMKVLEGGRTPFALPENVASQVGQEEAQARKLQDTRNQKEVNQIAQVRAQRLSEQDRLKTLANRGKIAAGAKTIGAKIAGPIVGGYEAGAQGAQAYNRLTRPDLEASDVASGGLNLAGAAAGLRTMFPGKGRVPAALGSIAADKLADFLDKRNPRKEDEEKARGGLVHLADGGVVPTSFAMPNMPAPQGMPNQNDPLYAQQTEIIPQPAQKPFFGFGDDVFEIPPMPEHKWYAPDIEEPGFYNRNNTEPTPQTEYKWYAPDIEEPGFYNKNNTEPVMPTEIPGPVYMNSRPQNPAPEERVQTTGAGAPQYRGNVFNMASQPKPMMPMSKIRSVMPQKKVMAPQQRPQTAIQQALARPAVNRTPAPVQARQATFPTKVQQRFPVVGPLASMQMAKKKR